MQIPRRGTARKLTLIILESIAQFPAGVENRRRKEQTENCHATNENHGLDATIVVLKNTGHWGLEENPNDTTEAL